MEPFLLDSNFGCNLTEGALNTVRLRDAFDMENWKLQASKRKLAPLVSWNVFQMYAPHNLIINSTHLYIGMKCYAVTLRHLQRHSQSHNSKILLGKPIYKNSTACSMVDLF